MRPDRLSAAIRPRRPWESIDLGFALARRWFLPLWLLWWITALPMAMLLLLPLHDRPSLWALAFWWFKPLFEAPLLFWLSRALFGDHASVAKTARQLPRTFPRRLWPYLFWRRLTLARSFTMPATLLEGLSGRTRRERLRILGKRTSAASWLTIVCVHLEAILWLSALLLLAFLIPEGLPDLDLLAVLFDEQSLVYWIGTLCAVATMSLIAPFYVAAGFALYLGRRTEIEAWDLELIFRQAVSQSAARDIRGPNPDRPITMAPPTFGLFLLLATALVQPVTAQPLTQPQTQPPAQPSAQPSAGIGATMPTPDEAKTLIETVLADDDFGSTREERVWVYVGDGNADAEGANPPGWLPMRLIIAIAEAAKWIIAALALAALALILYRLWLELRGLTPAWPRRRGRSGASATLVSDGVPRQDLLPADIPSAVHALLAAGDARGALGLLYRAQIAHLRTLGLDIPDSATEGDCISAAARRAPTQQLDWLRHLLRLWQAVAYAHRTVDTKDIARLLATRPAVRSETAADAQR